MAKDDKEIRRAKFLKELSALTRKYRVGIGGCGCCGSPFLTEIEGPVRGGKYEITEVENDRLCFVGPAR